MMIQSANSAGKNASACLAVGVVSGISGMLKDGWHKKAVKTWRQKEFVCRRGGAGVYVKRPAVLLLTAIWISAPRPVLLAEQPRGPQRGTKERFNYGLRSLAFRRACVCVCLLPVGRY